MNIFVLNNFLLLTVIFDQTYGCSSACSSCIIPTSNCCQQICQSSCTESVCATSAPVKPASGPAETIEAIVPSVESSNPINVTSIVDVKNEIHNTNEIRIPINITNVNSNYVNGLGGRTQTPQPCNNTNTNNCTSDNNSTRISIPIPIPIPVPVPQDRPVPVPQPFLVPIPFKQPYPVPIPYTNYIPLPQPYNHCQPRCNNIHPIFPYPLSFPSKSWDTPGSFPSLSPPYPPFNMFGG